MTLENARVLYKHRLSLGKDVSDILRRYPELADENEPEPEARFEQDEVPEKDDEDEETEEEAEEDEAREG